MHKPPRYATIHNPTLQAVAHQLFRFNSAGEAAAQIDAIRNHFIIAKKQIANPAHPSVILWIKGFEVTEEDRGQGIIGHFAVITCKASGNRFTLHAAKMDTDAREHPQRGQVMRDNPNWGHPVLRSARKGKRYATVEAAQAELTLLHEHTPKSRSRRPASSIS